MSRDWVDYLLNGVIAIGIGVMLLSLVMLVVCLFTEQAPESIPCKCAKCQSCEEGR